MKSQVADVIVIGAGMSGLVAAKKLQERLSSVPAVVSTTVGSSSSSSSTTVMVLEARDRLGGRIHTLQPHENENGPGTAIEMGAAWIHGHSKKNPISQLVKQVQAHHQQQAASDKNKKKTTTKPTAVKLFHTNWDNIMVYNTDATAPSNGGPAPVIPNQKLRRAHQQHAQLLNRVQHVLEEANTDVSLYQAIQKLQPPALQDPLLNLIMAMEEETEFGGPLDDLSTWWFDGDDEFPGQEALISHGGGLQTLIDHVASGLDVRTNVQVQRICYQSSSLSSSSANGNGTRSAAENNNPNHHENGPCVQIETTNQGTFTAKYCIVTVPLGVLKANTIQFQPALPLPKQAAIRHVGFGTIAKVVLVFENIFWPKSTHIFAHIAQSRTSNSQRGQYPYLLNMTPATKKPILVAFAGGEYVKKEMEAMDDQAIVQKVMEIVCSMFGKNVTTQPIQSYVTRWGTDPYSRGTYSYHAVGQKNSAWHDLADSVDGVLYFAGEHCSKNYRGTVHGAYLSGERAAKLVYQQIEDNASKA